MKDRIEWWVDNKYIHREDGPAVIFTDGPQKGSQIWMREGKKTRLDGPAAIWYTPGPYKYRGVDWWIDDGMYSFKDYCKKVKHLISDEAYFILILTYGDDNE